MKRETRNAKPETTNNKLQTTNMEFILGLLIALIPICFFPFVTGWAALSMNRKFWPWFIAGLFLPFLGIAILLCLPVKEKRISADAMRPVSSEEIFDQVLEVEAKKHINGNGIHFSARA